MKKLGSDQFELICTLDGKKLKWIKGYNESPEGPGGTEGTESMGTATKELEYKDEDSGKYTCIADDDKATIFVKFRCKFCGNILYVFVTFMCFVCVLCVYVL